MTETTIETNSLLIKNALLQSNAAQPVSSHALLEANWATAVGKQVLLLAIAAKLGVAA